MSHVHYCAYTRSRCFRHILLLLYSSAISPTHYTVDKRVHVRERLDWVWCVCVPANVSHEYSLSFRESYFNNANGIRFFFLFHLDNNCRFCRLFLFCFHLPYNTMHVQPMKVVLQFVHRVAPTLSHSMFPLAIHCCAIAQQTNTHTHIKMPSNITDSNRLARPTERED